MDMTFLERLHIEATKEFHQGNVVVHKSAKKFSGMAIDQAHEPNDTVIKGDGGAIRLTNDPGKLRRWMMVGPK